eukprot:gnl/Chilomastix_caulleri/3922.p3 GENE.gnl/Chilomastix_caulleri/3922~~gnl/Chilomastix_caulleri/3922.p3  ORF type:complete len:54 (-),score=4.51 gnl/Chilomastix_caulleri/3922:31-192(-)
MRCKMQIRGYLNPESSGMYGPVGVTGGKAGSSGYGSIRNYISPPRGQIGNLTN